jgi:hypothetical protein
VRPNLSFRRAEVEGDVQDWLMTTLKLDGLGARTSDFSLLHDPRTALQNGRHRLCPPAAHPNKLFESKQLADATKGSAASAMGCRSAAAHKSPRCTPAPASKACLGSIMESNGARGELEISCAEEASGRTQANRREQIGLAAPTLCLARAHGGWRKPCLTTGVRMCYGCKKCPTVMRFAFLGRYGIYRTHIIQVPCSLHLGPVRTVRLNHLRVCIPYPHSWHGLIAPCSATEQCHRKLSLTHTHTYVCTAYHLPSFLSATFLRPLIFPSPCAPCLVHAVGSPGPAWAHRGV